MLLVFWLLRRIQNKMLKKSQMEIMGLAIIIILISLALIFTVRFVVLKKPIDIKKQYTQIELASNMINTLLRTTTEDCSSLSFTGLFQDCADNYNPHDPIQSGTIVCDTGEKSCAYLQSKIPDIFDKTLEKWRVGYYFEAVVGTNTLVSDRCDSCADEICPARTHKEFPIPTGTTTINIKLDICA